MTAKITIENTWGSVPAGEEEKGIISFPVTVDEIGNPVTLDYFTLDGTATYGEDYIAIDDPGNETQATGSIELNSNDLTSEIELTILGETPVNPSGTEQNNNFEIFSKDTVNRTWVSGQDISYNPQTGEQLSYGDLGYRVNKFFNDQTTGFQAVGLTSDEIFFVILTDPSGTVLQENADTGENLLNELETVLGGDPDTLKDQKSQEIYQNAQNTIEQLEQNDTNWTYATGTTYDLGKAPVLVLRGTQVSDEAANNPLADVISDTDPNGIGFNQFSANQDQIFDWLDEVSSPEQEEPQLTFAPHITGHSLGAALAQWTAANYDNKMGQIVTFSPPGIAEDTFNGIKGANDFDQNNVDSVMHYISSGDIVAVAGEKHIWGDYVLSVFPTDTDKQTIKNLEILMLELHVLPVIVDQIDLNLVALTEGDKDPSPMKKPEGLIQNQPQPISDFDAQECNYPGDPNYMAILETISKIGIYGPRVAAAMAIRATVEQVRQEVGETLFKKNPDLIDKRAIDKAILKAIIKLPPASKQTICNQAEKTNDLNGLNQDSNQAAPEVVSSQAEPPEGNTIQEASQVLAASADSNPSDFVISQAEPEVPVRTFWEALPFWSAAAWNSISEWQDVAWEAADAWEEQYWATTTTLSDLEWQQPLLIPLDAEVVEEDNGTANAGVKVLLHKASSEPITVEYTTEEDTATAGEDFSPTSGTLHFAPGEVEQEIILEVKGDKELESDESFLINFQVPNNVTGIDLTSQVTIKYNDDFSPILPIERIFGTTAADVIQLPNTQAQQLVFAGEGDDLVDATSAYEFDLQHVVYGGLGNDIIVAGSKDILLGNEGDDAFYITSGGDNILTGGIGADQFWLATAEYPAAINQITDFEPGIDVLGIGGLGLEFVDLSLTHAAQNTIVSIASNGLELATLLEVAPEQLSADNFVFA